MYDDRWHPIRAQPGDRHLPRPPGSRPPCGRCPKIPPGAEPRPESAAEAGPELRRAYEHYRECLAVGDFPRDPWVRECAAAFHTLEEERDKAEGWRQLLALGRIVREG